MSDKKPIARLSIAGGNNDSAGLIKIEKLVKSRFNNIHNIETEIKNKKVYLYENSISREELESFKDHTDKKDLKGNNSTLRIEYTTIESFTKKQDESTKDYIRRLEKEKILLKRKFETANKQKEKLEIQNEQLQENLDKTDSDLEEFLVENEAYSDKIEKLKEENESMKHKISQGSIHAKTFHGMIRPYLCNIAKRISELEDFLDKTDYRLPEESAKELFKHVRDLDLEEVNSLEDISKLTKKYTENKLKRTFDNKHDDELQEYQEAKIELENNQEESAKLEDLNFSNDAKEKMKDVVGEEIEKLERKINIYENKKQKFVEDTQKELLTISEKLEKIKNLSQIREKVKKLNCNNIYFYMELEEDSDDYIIDTYLPTLKNKKSDICNTIFKQRISGKDVTSLLKEKDLLENLDIQYETNSELSYYRIKLSKEKYSLDEVMQIRTAMESQVNKEYKNSFYAKIGINPNPIISPNLSLEKSQKTTEHIYSGIPISRDSQENRFEIYEEILLEAKDQDEKLSMSEILERAEKKGEEIARSTANNDFTKLVNNEIIIKQGKGRGTKYIV